MNIWTLLVNFLTFLWRGIVVPLVCWRFNLFRMIFIWNSIFHPQPPVTPSTVRVIFTPGVPYTSRPARTVQITPGTPVTQSRYLQEP